MKNIIHYPGLDVHKDSISAAVAVAGVEVLTASAKRIVSSACSGREFQRKVHKAQGRKEEQAL